MYITHRDWRAEPRAKAQALIAISVSHFTRGSICAFCFWCGYKQASKHRSRDSLVAQWLRIACQCRGHRFDPWSGKIPHATEQLSLCTTTTKPALRAYEPQLVSPRATTTEARAPRAHALQQEKPGNCNEE